ncbi:hypothetical protein, partial [Bradyrhizobium brasilense]|uniref:hypothetical protein n=1 Tax=Bradyrhizobium brasilense TaxID=1419277 RepID=UPI001E60C207
SLKTSLSAADALRVQAAARREGLTASQWLRATALDRLEGSTSAPAAAGPEGEAADVMSARLVHVGTRLASKEAVALGTAARARGMRPSAWLRSLTAVRLGKGAQYSGQEQVALGRLAAEVSRVGVNLNQAVRLAHEARKMGKPIALDVAVIEAAKAAVTTACATFLEVAKGNIRYWEDGH